MEAAGGNYTKMAVKEIIISKYNFFIMFNRREHVIYNYTIYVIWDFLKKIVIEFLPTLPHTGEP